MGRLNDSIGYHVTLQDHVLNGNIIYSIDYYLPESDSELVHNTWKSVQNRRQE